MPKEYSQDFIEVSSKDEEFTKKHQLILGAIAPRPIALTGTINSEGKSNLAPFSSFNYFGSNPICLALSTSIKARSGHHKNTYLNIQETQEFTVNIVNFDMAHQINLISGDFDSNYDEFYKSGFTKHPSKKIKPFGVGESPCILECRLIETLNLGNKPGSANILLGEVIYMHIKKSVLNKQGHIDPYKIDQIAKLGGDWYTRAKEGLFHIPHNKQASVGFDVLPRSLLESTILTGNDLAQLVAVTEMPELLNLNYEETRELHLIYLAGKTKVHELIRNKIRDHQIQKAWEALIYFHEINGL